MESDLYNEWWLSVFVIQRQFEIDDKEEQMAFGIFHYFLAACDYGSDT